MHAEDANVQQCWDFSSDLLGGGAQFGKGSCVAMMMHTCAAYPCCGIVTLTPAALDTKRLFLLLLLLLSLLLSNQQLEDVVNPIVSKLYAAGGGPGGAAGGEEDLGDHDEL
jgi:hypothetical protein